MNGNMMDQFLDYLESTTPAQRLGGGLPGTAAAAAEAVHRRYCSAEPGECEGATRDDRLNAAAALGAAAPDLTKVERERIRRQLEHHAADLESMLASDEEADRERCVAAAVLRDAAGELEP